MADADPPADDDPAATAIRACPNCASSRIYARLSMSPKYRCNECGHEFDTPTRRRTGEGPKHQG